MSRHDDSRPLGWGVWIFVVGIVLCAVVGGWALADGIISAVATR